MSTLLFLANLSSRFHSFFLDFQCFIPLSISIVDTSNRIGSFIDKIVEVIDKWYKAFSAEFGTDWTKILWFLLIFLLIYFFTHLIFYLKLCVWESNGIVGPINIEEVKESDGEVVNLRLYLSECGGKCTNPTNTDSPSSNPGYKALTTELAAIDESKKNFVNAIVAFFEMILEFLGGRKIGYLVTFLWITPKIPNEQFSAFIEIKKSDNGVLLKSNKLSNSDKDELIKHSAYWIMWAIRDQDRVKKHIPRWHRFPSYESFCLYRRAEELRDQEDQFIQQNSQKSGFIKKLFEKKLQAPLNTENEIESKTDNLKESTSEAYEKAIESAHFNALVRLSYGDYLETKQDYLKALRIYLEAVLMWPHLFDIVYRILAIYSYAEKWFSDWNKLSLNEKYDFEFLFLSYLETTKNILKRSFTRNKFNDYLKLFDLFELPDKHEIDIKIHSLESKNNYLNYYFNRSRNLGNLLESIIKNMFALWINRYWKNLTYYLFEPIKFSRTLQKYFWNLMPFFGWSEGKQFLKSIQIANVCTDIQLMKINNHDGVDEKIKLIEEIKKRNWKDMSEMYNLACFYAHISDGVDGYADEANNLLKIAYNDHRSELDIEWIKIDPDLENLKNNPEFVYLYDISKDKK